MDNKITIIEGPTPTFEPVIPGEDMDNPHAWMAGVMEGPFLYDMAFTSVRAFDSQQLLDRCENAWAEKHVMFLEYKDRLGLTKESPIIAARAVNVEEGDMLLLWVRQDIHTEDDTEDLLSFGDDDDDDDYDNDEDNFDDIF